MPFAQSIVCFDFNRQSLGDYLRRLNCPTKVTAIQYVDIPLRQTNGHGFGLLDSQFAQRTIKMALLSSAQIPFGFAVPDSK
jgi:hypothetical protein